MKELKFIQIAVSPNADLVGLDKDGQVYILFDARGWQKVKMNLVEY